MILTLQHNRNNITQLSYSTTLEYIVELKNGYKVIQVKFFVKILKRKRMDTTLVTVNGETFWSNGYYFLSCEWCVYILWTIIIWQYLDSTSTINVMCKTFLIWQVQFFIRMETGTTERFIQAREWYIKTTATGWYARVVCCKVYVHFIFYTPNLQIYFFTTQYF